MNGGGGYIYVGGAGRGDWATLMRDVMVVVVVVGSVCVTEMSTTCVTLYSLLLVVDSEVVVVPFVMVT